MKRLFHYFLIFLFIRIHFACVDILFVLDTSKTEVSKNRAIQIARDLPENQKIRKWLVLSRNDRYVPRIARNNDELVHLLKTVHGDFNRFLDVASSEIARRTSTFQPFVILLFSESPINETMTETWKSISKAPALHIFRVGNSKKRQKTEEKEKIDFEKLINCGKNRTEEIEKLSSKFEKNDFRRKQNLATFRTTLTPPTIEPFIRKLTFYDPSKTLLIDRSKTRKNPTTELTFTKIFKKFTPTSRPKIIKNQSATTPRPRTNALKLTTSKFQNKNVISRILPTTRKPATTTNKIKPATISSFSSSLNVIKPNSEWKTSHWKPRTTSKPVFAWKTTIRSNNVSTTKKPFVQMKKTTTSTAQNFFNTKSNSPLIKHSWTKTTKYSQKLLVETTTKKLKISENRSNNLIKQPNNLKLTTTKTQLKPFKSSINKASTFVLKNGFSSLFQRSTKPAFFSTTTIPKTVRTQIENILPENFQNEIKVRSRNVFFALTENPPISSSNSIFLLEKSTKKHESTTTKIIKIPNDCMAEIYFLIDFSRGTGDKSQQYLDIAASTISLLPISQNFVRVGLISFSGPGRTRVHFYLDKHNQKDSLIEEMFLMERKGGTTRTSDAIRYSTKIFNNLAHPTRKGVKKYLIVLTDGYSQDNPKEAAQLARANGIQLIVICVEDKIALPDQQQLAEIAGNVQNVLISPNGKQVRDKIIGKQQCQL